MTTHDLSLTELAHELPGRVRNMHFTERVVDGAWSSTISFGKESSPAATRSISCGSSTCRAPGGGGGLHSLPAPGPGREN